MTYQDMLREWRRGNDDGQGFAVGDDDSNPNALDGVGTLLIRAATREEIAVYQDHSGGLIGVGDLYGPWAVRLS